MKLKEMLNSKASKTKLLKRETYKGKDIDFVSYKNELYEGVVAFVDGESVAGNGFDFKTKQEAFDWVRNYIDNLPKQEKKSNNIQLSNLQEDTSVDLFLDGFKYISLEQAFQNANEEPELLEKLKKFSKNKSRENETIFDDVTDFAEKQGWILMEGYPYYTYNDESPLENDIQYYGFKGKNDDEYYFIYLKHIGRDARVGFDFYKITSNDYEFDEDVITMFSEDAVDYTYNTINNGKIEVNEYEAGSVFNSEMYSNGMYYKINKKGNNKKGNFDNVDSVTYITKKLFDKLPQKDKDKFTSM